MSELYLENMSAANKVFSSLMLIKCRSVFEQIADFPYAYIKGEALSFFAFKTYGNRYWSDIDILINKGMLKEIHSVLLNNGFKYNCLTKEERVLHLAYSHQTPSYTKQCEIININIIIDLNCDIFWGEYTGKRIDIDEFLSDTIVMDIYGVRVKTLPPLKAMVQLILHHYKDMNSIFLLATRKSIKYDMFKDVYYLLKNNLDTITLDKLYAMSSRYEIIPYVFYILYHTGQVFDDEILRQYIEAFKTPEGEALLDCYGLCAKEQKKWKCDFKTRLEAENLYDLIKDDLAEKDKEKIAINKRVFLGVSE